MDITTLGIGTAVTIIGAVWGLALKSPKLFFRLMEQPRDITDKLVYVATGVVASYAYFSSQLQSYLIELQANEKISFGIYLDIRDRVGERTLNSLWFVGIVLLVNWIIIPVGMHLAKHAAEVSRDELE